MGDSTHRLCCINTKLLDTTKHAVVVKGPFDSGIQCRMHISCKRSKNEGWQQTVNFMVAHPALCTLRVCKSVRREQEIVKSDDKEDEM